MFDNFKGLSSKSSVVNPKERTIGDLPGGVCYSRLYLIDAAEYNTKSPLSFDLKLHNETKGHLGVLQSFRLVYVKSMAIGKSEINEMTVHINLQK
jgi:hypothetical protein